MSKYSEGLAGQTVSYIEDGSYSISEIREMPDISKKTEKEEKTVTFVTFLNKSPSSQGEAISPPLDGLGEVSTVDRKSVTFVTFLQ